jgi:predicted nucleotidyltransferase
MKALEEIKGIISQHRSVLADKYGVAVVAVFGSYVRDEQKRESDIDLLAEILRPISLLELTGAEIYLSEILGAKVDLVPKRSVREELKDAILKEAVAL